MKQHIALPFLIVMFLLIVLSTSSAENSSSYVLLAKKDGKTRIFLSNGELLCEQSFDRVNGVYGGFHSRLDYILVSKNSKWGLLSVEKKKLTTEMKYVDAFAHGGHYFLKSNNSVWSVLNPKAALIGSFCCDSLFNISNTSKSDKRRFVYRKGKIWGILDKNFKILYESECSKLWTLRNSVTVRVVGKSLTLLGADFKKISEREFRYVTDFSNPMLSSEYRFSKDADQYRYMDYKTPDGRDPYIVIGKTDELAVLIDEEGKEKCVAEGIRYIGKGFYYIQDSKGSKITNFNGVSKKFASQIFPSSFANGILPYSLNRKFWGYMNTDLEEFILPKYKEAGMHVINGEHAIVKLDGEYLLVDREGNNKTGLKFKNLECKFYGAMDIKFETNNTIGIMDKEGKIVFALSSEIVKDVHFPKFGKSLIESKDGFEILDLESMKRKSIEGVDKALADECIAEVNGYVLANKDLLGFVDCNGKVVLPFAYDAVYPIILEVGEKK